MKNEPMILSTSPEAAKLVTVTGWVSRDGIFYGDKEDIARYAGCTHRPCEDCQKPTSKHYIRCDECRSKFEHEQWLKMPLVEWDGEPLVIHWSDTHFFNEDDVYEYAEENELKVSDLDLVICEPNYARQVDEDYWQDELAEDGELPAVIEDALKVFNAVIHAYKEPLSWSQGKKRVVLPDSPTTVNGEQR